MNRAESPPRPPPPPDRPGRNDRVLTLRDIAAMCAGMWGEEIERPTYYGRRR